MSFNRVILQEFQLDYFENASRHTKFFSFIFIQNVLHTGLEPPKRYSFNAALSSYASNKRFKLKDPKKQVANWILSLIVSSLSIF